MPHTKHKQSKIVPGRAPLTFAQELAREAATLFNTSAEHDLMLLGKAQFWYLNGVVQLGEMNAYNDRIRAFLKENYGKEFNTGHLSGLATTLEKHQLIIGRKGGSPTGKGRPITLYKLTKKGEDALRYTCEFHKWKNSYIEQHPTRHSHGAPHPHDETNKKVYDA